MKKPLKVDRYLSDGDRLLSDLRSAVNAKSQPLKITTCGLLKAGKSSLLNALTDHLEKELFATGAIRTTVQNQTLSHKDFTFVDTPGLDATDEDDEEAWQGVNEADVILFIHHPGTGELHKDEVDFLVELNSRAEASKDFEHRLVIILTHLESNVEVIDGIAESVLCQIEKFIDIRPQIFQVSFTAYKKGMLQNKPKLVEYSGIPILREHIVGSLDRVRRISKVVRQNRINANLKNMLVAIDEQVTLRQGQRNSLQQQMDQSRKALEADMTKLLKDLRNKISAYYEQAPVGTIE